MPKEIAGMFAQLIKLWYQLNIDLEATYKQNTKKPGEI